MKITALKEQVKNPDRVNVFVDEKYALSLTIAEIVDHKVRVNNELDETRLEYLKKVSSDGKIRQRAYEWLLNRPHSTRELKDYLRRKKIGPELVEKLISDFTDKSVLNDERFTEWYTERALRKNKSVRMMSHELRGKGVSFEVGKLADTDDMASLSNLIAKLADRPRYADQSRLIRFLQGKGFSYSDIKSALKLREPEQEI